MDKDKNKKNKKNFIHPLRTFKTDMNDYVKKKGVSMVDIMLANQKKKNFWSLKNRRKVFSGKAVIITAAALLFIGGFSLIFLLARKNSEPNPVVEVSLKPIITADRDEAVSVKNIGDILKVPVPSKKLLNISVFSGNGENKKTILSADKFFEGAGISVPRPLADSLDGKFMLGVFRSSRKSPVLILKVKFYERAFASMINWEKNMFENLGIFFGGEETEPNSDGFIDKEIRNTDTRILYDTEGNPILIYAFFGKKYLVITDNKDALVEIFRRLSSSRYLDN
ncbi:MAG: hypothetical protein GXP44_01145 [bacterium]|nr:hypothetical protein [bacterium]